MSKISRRAMMAAAIPSTAAQLWPNNPAEIVPVDRECWKTDPDYSPEAITAWLRMGLGLDVPRKPEDPKWDIWLEFNRQRFRHCVRNSIDRSHKERPGSPIGFQNLYTTLVPEKPELPVDFLINSSKNRARLDSRYLAQTGKVWGFQVSNIQEASVVLAQGGIPIYPQALEVSRLCRERQALCHKSQTLSEVAILFSRTSLYRKSNQLFGDWGKHVDPCSALLDSLVQCHCSVDVMPDWAPLTWPLLVIPEWEEIGDTLARDIAEQVRGGLKLFLTGAANARKFSSLLGRKLEAVHEIGKSRVVLASGPSPALVQRCLEALGPAQISIKDSTAPLELVIRKQAQLPVLHFINRLNTLPSQQVRLKLPNSPKNIFWQPSDRSIKFAWLDGQATFVTPRISTHAMAAID